MKSVVGERGQVTIPKKLRDRLGIRPGQTLEFEEDRGRLVARKAQQQDPVETIYGRFADGRKTDDVMAELRGAPDGV